MLRSKVTIRHTKLIVYVVNVVYKEKSNKAVSQEVPMREFRSETMLAPLIKINFVLHNNIKKLGLHAVLVVLSVLSIVYNLVNTVTVENY